LAGIDEAVLRAGADRVMIMGDFNYPEIEYHNGTVLATGGADPARLFDRTQELCLFQIIDQPTRVRQGQKQSLLHYVFIDEDNTVEEVIYGPPLGKSDHVVLEWRVVVSVKEVTGSEEKFNYWKGNYGDISSAMLEIDWQKRLEGRSADEMWEVFGSFMKQKMEECIL